MITIIVLLNLIHFINVAWFHKKPIAKSALNIPKQVQTIGLGSALRYYYVDYGSLALLIIGLLCDYYFPPLFSLIPFNFFGYQTNLYGIIFYLILFLITLIYLNKKQKFKLIHAFIIANISVLALQMIWEFPSNTIINYQNGYLHQILSVWITKLPIRFTPVFLFILYINKFSQPKNLLFTSPSMTLSIIYGIKPNMPFWVQPIPILRTAWLTSFLLIILQFKNPLVTKQY